MTGSNSFQRGDKFRFFCSTYFTLAGIISFFTERGRGALYFWGLPCHTKFTLILGEKAIVCSAGRYLFETLLTLYSVQYSSSTTSLLSTASSTISHHFSFYYYYDSVHSTLLYFNQNFSLQTPHVLGLLSQFNPATRPNEYLFGSPAAIHPQKVPNHFNLCNLT